MFFYQDNPRLQLFFSSPNLCGCFCAMLLALCVGAWLMALKRNRPWLAGVIGAAGALWAFLLAATYSRGGLIATLCAVLAIFLHSRKWLALCWLAVTVIAFASVGGGGDRIASLGDAASDGSIRNRVFLWRGACGCIPAHMVYERISDWSFMRWVKVWAEFAIAFAALNALSRRMRLRILNRHQ